MKAVICKWFRVKLGLIDSLWFFLFDKRMLIVIPEVWCRIDLYQTNVEKYYKNSESKKYIWVRFEIDSTAYYCSGLLKFEVKLSVYIAVHGINSERIQTLKGRIYKYPKLSKSLNLHQDAY